MRQQPPPLGWGLGQSPPCSSLCSSAAGCSLGDTVSHLPHRLSVSKKGPKRSWESELRETKQGREGLPGMREDFFSPHPIPRPARHASHPGGGGGDTVVRGICGDSGSPTALCCPAGTWDLERGELFEDPSV